MKQINIQGARVHNLKGFNLSLPKNKLIVATGVSGSGKSSLVFDILFEEGRRQYLQSLGILPQIDEENKFDSISGIAPTVAVKQNIIRQNSPRSTVGTRTQILNLLCLLFAGDGHIHCADCGSIVGQDLVCPHCGREEERLDAGYFSYNAPNGMCLRCAGRGGYYEINLEKLIPNSETTLEEVFSTVGGITPGYKRLLFKQFKEYLSTPFRQLPAEIKDEVLYGHYVNNNYQNRSYCLTRVFEMRLKRDGEDLSGIYSQVECEACAGSRVGEEARRVTFNGLTIGDIGKLTLHELKTFLNTLDQEPLTGFGKKLVEEISRKTNQLIRSRLGHLSLYRELPTLSGGEIQRLFLNAHLDSKMDSLIYILDEPTIGLHEAEKEDLLQSITALKDLGNTVIVVEHDRRTIELAQHIIDIGPKAGVEGGEIVYQGDLNGLLACETSLTGQYLSGKIPMPERKKINFDPQTSPGLTLHGAQTNNLKNVTTTIPLGCLVGIAGVSGSGKSSLIANTLVPLLKGYFQESRMQKEEDGEDESPAWIKTIAEKLEGTQALSGFAEVSQAPIGRKTNSNPATYLGIWDKVRKVFADQPEAINRGLSAGHFSFNSKGACEVCGGSGKETLRLGNNFSLEITCRTCEGKRYHTEALSVDYQGKNIYEVLEMSIAEAIPFFKTIPGISQPLKTMQKIGMGYIKLGQPTPTLSGGEAQRIKLAKEIGKRRKGNILYILDEPTTGLSMYDTAQLIRLLNELLKKGNSILVIEHDCSLLSVCDWIIELGPGAGVDGGEIICNGTPETLKHHPHSLTGRYLS